MGSRWALDRAKQNVETWYPVVGVLEELRDTIDMLEIKVPEFFRNASEVYDREFKSW